jgi:trigger factor
MAALGGEIGEDAGMSSTIEKISSNQVKLGFTVEPELFEKGMESAYRKVVKRINIPGFRKGHAPRKVIELHYGESIFYEDAFDAIFPEIYDAAIKEHELSPVDQPKLDVDQIEKGKPVTFSATVYVRPEVVLGEYKGVKASKAEVNVTEDDVNAELERARERVARYIDVTDRPVKLDDQVNIDYKGTVDGVAFEGGSAEGHLLTIGSGSFIPGFEEGLIGVNSGDELDVHVTFPEEYHAENLKGKPAVFHVKVNAIQQKELPALDDEFAKDVSEFDTLSAYKDDVRAKLVKRAQDRADSEFENEVIETVVDDAQADIPEPMVQNQIDQMLRDMELRMMYQGMKMEDFLKYTGQTIESMRDSQHDDALRRVKTQLVLDAVRKAENIEASEEEVKAQIEKFAPQTGKSAEDFEKTLSDGDRRYFQDMASVEKTIDLIKNAAVSD